jgi:hypothetical protein
VNKNNHLDLGDGSLLVYPHYDLLENTMEKWRKSADLVGFYEDLMAHFIGIEWDYNQKS